MVNMNDYAFLRKKSPRRHEKAQPRLPSTLLRLILLSNIMNVLQAVWIAVDTAWLQQRYSKTYGLLELRNAEVRNLHKESTASAYNVPTRPLKQQIYHEFIRTVSRPVYPKHLYDPTWTTESTDQLIGGFDPDGGVVALPKGQPHILRSEQFPWDPDKEIFVLAGYHSLHSIQIIWQTLRKFAGDKPLTGHALHSLNVLWNDALCAADTTPRSVSKSVLANRTAIEEARQTRQCRDWREVEAFAKRHSACFKDLGAARDNSPNIEEWQFCAWDSPYLGPVYEYIANAAE